MKVKSFLSTVAPKPEVFALFQDSPCVLDSSLHATNDEMRNNLVTTTKYSMNELQQWLVDTPLQRPKHLRATILEEGLINGTNDTHEAV